MQVDKEDVVDLLRSRGQHDKAASIQCALPRHVDTEADAGLLHQFEVSVRDVRQAAGAPDGADGTPVGGAAKP